MICLSHSTGSDLMIGKDSIYRASKFRMYKSSNYASLFKIDYFNLVSFARLEARWLELDSISSNKERLKYYNADCLTTGAGHVPFFSV